MISCRASLDNESIMTIVGLDLYSASTITVRYDVSWIIHVDKQLPFVAKVITCHPMQMVVITCYPMLYFLGLYEIPKMFQG